MSDYGNLGNEIGTLLKAAGIIILVLAIALIFGCCTRAETYKALSVVEVVGWTVCAVIVGIAVWAIKRKK